MIGCQKCGTTSLVADMLTKLSVTCGATLPGEPRKLWKEKHFFDNGECKFNPAACFENNSAVPASGQEAARAHYLAHFPECSDEKPLPAGAASMDATPRYMRVPMVPHRIRSLYGETLAKQLTIVIILRDPETRAFSWFRFFALNACEGKSWATDQLEKRFWFHFNEGSFGRWAQAQVEKYDACKARGIAPNEMWPQCDSETGMFAGFYSLQIRHWLQAGFNPSQIILIPMDCYVSAGGASLSLSTIAEAAHLQAGVSLPELDKRFKHENSKRLKQVLSGGGDQAAGANRHGERPLPLNSSRTVKKFFQRESDEMVNLLLEFPTIKVVDCGTPHFFKKCVGETCLPSFSESIVKLDADVAAAVANGTLNEPRPVFGVNWR
jgi:hypothetical protein